MRGWEDDEGIWRMVTEVLVTFFFLTEGFLFKARYHMVHIWVACFFWSFLKLLCFKGWRLRCVCGFL